jgi:hypothetical protein
MMVAWAILALLVVVVAQGWLLRRSILGLMAQLAVLTVILHEVLDRVVDLEGFCRRK